MTKDAYGRFPQIHLDCLEARRLYQLRSNSAYRIIRDVLPLLLNV